MEHGDYSYRSGNVVWQLRREYVTSALSLGRVKMRLRVI
jgi:hypothetical protein